MRLTWVITLTEQVPNRLDWDLVLADNSQLVYFWRVAFCASSEYELLKVGRFTIGALGPA